MWLSVSVIYSEEAIFVVLKTWKVGDLIIIFYF